MTDNEIMNTGTTTLGLMCKDCIVMAADKRVTAGNMIVKKDVNKVFPINDKMALTIAGTVSDIQLIVKLIKAEVNLKKIRVDRDITVKEVANLLGNIVYNNIRRPSMIPGITHFLLGGTDEELRLYDIFADGTVDEVSEFISSGSGSVFVYGVLENQYKPGLSEAEGVDLAVKAINAALQRDTASGQGIDVFVINKDGVRKAAEKKVNTYAQ